MAVATTYSELLDQIKQVVVDESTELSSYLPFAVGLAEDRLFLHVDYDYTKEGTLTTVPGQAKLEKPADYRVSNNMYLITGTERKRLIKRTEDFLKDYWTSTVATEEPKYYAEQDEGFFRLGPTPDQAYTVELEYEFRPTYLSNANPTNIWMQRYPALLFHATLSEVATFQGDTSLKAEQESEFMNLLSPVQKDTDRHTRDDDAGDYIMKSGRNRKSV